MRLTGRIVFAIRAAAELVGHEDYVPLDVIAERQDLPTDYVRSAMSDLRRAGIVSTRRGRVGGYRLARPADQITLAECEQYIGEGQFPAGSMLPKIEAAMDFVPPGTKTYSTPFTVPCG